jgi:hypothetical protein
LNATKWHNPKSAMGFWMRECDGDGLTASAHHRRRQRFAGDGRFKPTSVGELEVRPAGERSRLAREA